MMKNIIVNGITFTQHPKYNFIYVTPNAEICTILKYKKKGIKYCIKNQHKHTKDGYCVMNFRNDGKQFTLRIHRLVAETFLTKVNGKDTVNHIDGDKENNKLSNLEWANRYEQMKHAYKLGLKKSNKGTTNCGAKLDMDDLRYIKKHYIQGNKREHSPHEIAKQLNQMKHREQEIRPICIYSVTQGRTYKKEYASL